MKRLSICVPTFNRANYLAICLESIVASVRTYEESVEVLIVDNASTDGTEACVERLRMDRVPLRYVRNQENVGGEENFRLAAELALGEYVWVVGDDDLINPQAVGVVLAALSGEPGAVSLGLVGIEADDQQGPWRSQDAFRQTPAMSPNEALRRFGFELALISGAVLKRELFLGFPIQDYRRMKECGFSFLMTMYHAIMSAGRMDRIEGPVVGNRRGTWRLPSWERTFVIGPSKVAVELEKVGYAPRAISRAVGRAFHGYVLPELAAQRMNGENVRPMVKSVIKHYRNWNHVLAAWTLQWTPRSVIRGVYLLRRGIRRRLA